MSSTPLHACEFAVSSQTGRSMAGITEALTGHVHSRLRHFGGACPSKSVLLRLVETAYLATLKTEESRFVSGSITYPNPTAPDVAPPFRRRASYPAFT